MLEPNVSAGCDFPDEVKIELFVNNNPISMRYIYDNFSTSTTNIVLTNIEITD